MVKSSDSPRSIRHRTRSDGFRRSPSSDMGSVSLPSIRSTTGMSNRSNRSIKSRMYLPSEFCTPGPDAYNIKTTIGQSQAPAFKGDRSRTFEQVKSSNAVFLLPKLAGGTPAPGSYEIKSEIGKGLKSTFGTSRRDARFAGDRTNNAVFLLQKYDDPSPAPTRYNTKSSVGSRNGFSTREHTMGTGGTFSRAQRDSRYAGDYKANFLLPRIVPKNPAPTSYKTEDVSSFGKNAKGSTFGKSRRNARFPGDNRALFLLTERMDKFRRPHSFSSYGLE